MFLHGGWPHLDPQHVDALAIRACRRRSLGTAPLSRVLRLPRRLRLLRARCLQPTLDRSGARGLGCIVGMLGWRL